jgi:uncharacterized protein YajQ (UPF0234 family)
MKVHINQNLNSFSNLERIRKNMINKWTFRNEEWFIKSMDEIKKILSNSDLTYEQAKYVLSETEHQLAIRQEKMKVKD